MSGIDRATDEEQACFGLALVNNLESRHQIIKALEVIECSRVDDQGAVAGGEAVPKT
jgi:hypothetical protein